MADRIPLRHRLGTRLGVAFTITAVGAVAVATLLALVTAGGQVEQLQAEQRDEVVAGVVTALAVAYEAAGGWSEADLLPAHALAASAGAALVVVSASGAILDAPPGIHEFQDRLQRRTGTIVPRGPGGTDPPRRGGGASGADAEDLGMVQPNPVPMTLAVADTDAVEIDQELSAPIMVADRRVGTATLFFTHPGALDPIVSFRQSLARNLLLAGLAAIMLGLAVSVWVTPRLTLPVRRLTAAVRQLSGGDRTARSQFPDMVGELGVLARSVDRMAEDLDREDRLRRALVADIAHEVRTPLSILRGEVEALQDGIVEPTPEQLGSLHEEVLRLSRVIEDLDAIAAAEAAGFDLRRETIDLAEVVGAALAGLAPQLEAHGVTVATDLREVNVWADPRRVEQIVRNLLTNAARFCPPGGLVSVTVAPVGTDAIIEVTDDGPGIPPDELPQVFERFWRGRHAEGTAGSGVGLAVVAELAAAHDGVVRADNAEGRGARFTVRLPRAMPGG